MKPVLFCSVAWFWVFSNAIAGDLILKVPTTSVHFQSPSGFDYNRKNYGLGVGFEWDEREFFNLPVTYSVNILGYRDSFFCNAINVQGRALIPITDWISIGPSINLAHKCTSSRGLHKTFGGPTGVVAFRFHEDVRATVDCAPRVAGVNSTAFCGLSLEFLF